MILIIIWRLLVDPRGYLRMILIIIYLWCPVGYPVGYPVVPCGALWATLWATLWCPVGYPVGYPAAIRWYSLAC